VHQLSIWFLSHGCLLCPNEYVLDYVDTTEDSDAAAEAAAMREAFGDTAGGSDDGSGADEVQGV